MTYVADACAIIALLRGEDGGDKMRDLLLDPSSEARMHAVNLGEVYCFALWRESRGSCKSHGASVSPQYPNAEDLEMISFASSLSARPAIVSPMRMHSLWRALNETTQPSPQQITVNWILKKQTGSRWLRIGPDVAYI